MKTKIEISISKTQTMAKAARHAGMPFSTFKRHAQKLNLYVPNQGRKVIKGRSGGAS